MGGKWATEDVLPLNGTPEEVQHLREQMLLARAAARAKKEKKKAGKVAAAAVEENGAGVAVAGSEKLAEKVDAPGIAGTSCKDCFLLLLFIMQTCRGDRLLHLE